ncbi:MAG: S41 family peptidase [Patescibacteria group bacterium]
MQRSYFTEKIPKKWIILGFGCIFVSFLLGIFIGRGNVSEADSVLLGDRKVVGIGALPSPDLISEDIKFEQFWELWQMLELKYYDQISEEKMFYGAMQGLADSLGDPYTAFFEPATAKEFTDSLKGEFEGIGAEIGIRDEQLQIIAPLPDTPADRAGLRAGDYIIKINGTSTEDMTVEQAVLLIRGEKGTEVVLNIGRLTKTEDENATGTTDGLKPEVFDVAIIRDTIIIKSVEVKWPEKDIAQVKISNFNEDTADEFTDAMNQVVNKQPRAIILDLRNNPGGFLDRSTAIAGEWVGNRVVVVERRKGKIIDEFHGTGKGALASYPTVVLVNQGSASASEIVAGALQDYDLATVIGMQTFGKGSVQDFSEFKDGSAIKITVAEWLTPNGRSINNTGIEPDITVDMTLEDYNENRDPQLQKAVEYINNPEAVLSQTESPKEE